MRIVAGAAKGRRLVAPKGTDVRPTADRVKEALFSSLQPLLPGARVLDLFAGSGALGLEALSRGAASVTLVERSRPALDALRRNIEAVGLPGRTWSPGRRGGLAGDLPGEPFDLVLLDPPYHLPKAELATLLAALVAHLAPAATSCSNGRPRDGTPPGPRPCVRSDPAATVTPRCTGRRWPARSDGAADGPDPRADEEREEP
jgi:16S rRNA (guanine966-N2)-methyltransferase